MKVMQVLKRNAVILGVLVFVCAAVYLNWSLGKEAEEKAGAKTESPETATQVLAQDPMGAAREAGLYFSAEPEEEDAAVSTDTDGETTNIAEYFAGVRLSRSQARDEATETLQVACAATDVSQEYINTAATQIMDIAQWTMREADLENLIMAKGFEDCVVYMTPNGVSVTVPAPVDGLSDASVAKITDLILGETDYSAEQLKIVEIR